MKECKICLNSYPTSESLHQHLIDAGHFLTPQSQESNVLPVESSNFGRKGKIRTCQACSALFSNRKTLAAHLRQTGHFFRGKRKRNGGTTTPTLEKDGDYGGPLVSKQSDIYITEIVKCVATDEVETVQHETLQPHHKKSSEFHSDAISIPLQAQMHIDLLDPREWPSPERTPSKILIKPNENTFVVHQCYFSEPTPWKLIPITLPTCPVPFHDPPSKDLDPPIIDLLDEELNEITSVVPGVSREMDSISSIIQHETSSNLNSSSQLSLPTEIVSVNKELNENNNIHNSIQLNPDSITSYPILSCNTLSNNPTNIPNPNVEETEETSFSHQFLNTRPENPEVIDLPTYKLPYSSKKSLLTCENPSQAVSSMMPKSVASHSPTHKVDKPLPFQDSESLVPSHEVIVEGGVDHCSQCLTLVDIANTAFCILSGDVTYTCNVCKLRTIMKSVYKKRK